VDVIVGERHLERVERHGDVGAVLVAARRHVALRHADGVLREQPAVVANALPVAVGDLGDDLAALLDRLEHEADVELAADGGFDADLDVVEIDEDCDAGGAGISKSHEQSSWAGGADPGSSKKSHRFPQPAMSLCVAPKVSSDAETAAVACD